VASPVAALALEQVSALDNKGVRALRQLSLSVSSGEILGVAGVSGNGQVELAEVIAGVRPVSGGRVLAFDRDITNQDPQAVMRAGVGRIPEDGRANVVAEMTVAQNIVIEHLDDYRRGGRLDRRRIEREAEELITEYQIKARPRDPIRTLSGGNLQKVILARVLARRPKILVVSQPSRGLDVAATEYVRRRLVEQRDRGAAILLISEDLDEILALADRVAVLYEGRLMGLIPRAEATVERLGLWMAGVETA
jgi:simple sugar transport system ATP-binding protein